jgi:UPF0755 protein
MRRALGCLALLGVAAVAAGAWLLVWPYAGFSEPVFVEIPRGATTWQIARVLAEKRVIRTSAGFLLLRAARPRDKLKAGEYQFRGPASAWQVFDKIARGDIFYYTLVVPEGSNTFDIAASLERQHILPAAAFLAAAHDSSMVRDIDAKAPTLEGYLFPDTYRIARHTTAGQLCHVMTERFRAAWAKLGSPPADVHDTVTLASLVEKEAKRPEERPLVASVFANRLKIGMALQCDPTTIYAALVENRYRGTIYQSDLASRQAYNTYQHPGLPPGPIANPGLASIQAALRPAQTDYLYFVARADGSGAHQFSAGLAEHTRAVQEYRRGLREEQAGGAAHVR